MVLSPGPLLTQTDILSLPRPSAPVVNPLGNLAIWPSSTFDFKASKTCRQFNLIDLEKGTSGAAKVGGKVVKRGLDNLECAWLDDKTIVYLEPAPSTSMDEVKVKVEESNDEEYKSLKASWKKENEGGIEATQVWAFNVEDGEEYLLGQFPVPISNLQTRQVLPSSSSSSSSPSVLLGFSASVFPNSSSSIYTYPSEYSEFLKKQGGSDIKVYDSTFVRHWDEWIPTTGEKTQVFVVRLTKNPEDFKEESSSESEEEEEGEEEFEKIDEREGRWSFERERIDVERELEGKMVKRKEHRPKVLGPMKGTKLECPVGPFGSTSDYSLSPLGSHLLIHSKDPQVSPSWHTRTNLYLFSLSPRSSRDREPTLLSIGTQGASSCPRFSPDGGKVSWLEMREDGYEADRNRVMIHDLESGETKGVTEEWDSSPGSIEWGRDGKSLLVTTEERGHVVVYELQLTEKGEAKRRKLTNQGGTVSSVQALTNGKLLLGINSFTSPNELYLLSISSTSSSDDQDDNAKGPTEEPTLKLVASLTRNLLSTKSLSKGEEFVFPGSGGQEVHGWILFPPTTSSKPISKWDGLLPLANICHGGPQSSWTSSWSTRWNPQSYTAHGYVTVLMNRTGSTGFGQEFCVKIKEDWGGAPSRDLVAGIEYVKRAWKDKVDPERMANLGASYGGFMTNYIQGHNDAFGFKCLVCHDGVFNLAQTYYSTEELYFPTREFGGTPWENPSGYDKFNPANFIKNWKTPQLVIHGSRDYRLVESEGLGVFNTLQRLGIPSRLLIFPSENHWVLKPQNSLKWHEEVFRFIGEFTNTSEYKLE
ncbi:uncharacterized protein JCM6883_001616 [Sporobolomyces salmoneus]|uniref:uncharacterized protein n=1 Tax=Sporobolomyces salmoneus TaxID=183962 RepID=UPI0031795E05